MIDNKIKIYSSGPMAECTQEEMSDWRELVANQCSDWATFLHPTRRNFTCEYGSMSDQVVKQIVELDKIDIQSCDCVLVNLLPQKPAVGTNMEVLYAWTIGKLVVLVLPEGKPISPWHRYHSQKMVNSLQDALDYIHYGNWR